MPIEIQVGLTCTVLGFLIASLTFMRTRDKDVKTDARESGELKAQLNTIISGVANIQIDIKANERRTNELSERVIRVEESSKQAHKRIDSIENKRGVDKDE